MSEPPKAKKKNKKKKKPLSERNVTPPDENLVKPNEPAKSSLTINEVLPQHVGMKTIFNDVEVTMTHDGIANEIVNNSTSTAKKKKKKKKKSKQQLDNTQDTKSDVISENQNYLKFNEDRIELVNHPEISITITEPVTIPNGGSTRIEGKSAVSEQKETPDAVTSTTSSKKKKKKKKKKNNSEAAKPEETKTVAESGSNAPTYIKVPSKGDNCVLLVSHDSFSSNNNDKITVTSTETVSVTSNSDTVCLKRKDLADHPTGAALGLVFQPEPSVSIFPFTQGASKEVTGRGTFNIDNSLQKVNDMVKNELNDNEPSANAVPCESQEPTLSKAQLKAERRAKQEAQRAAKLANSAGKNAPNAPSEKTKPDVAKVLPVKENTQKDIIQESAEPKSNKGTLKNGTGKEVVSKIKKSQLFSHLPEWKEVSLRQISSASSKIPPSIIELGCHYSSGILRGSNARCVGFLAAFRDVVQDYKPVPNKELVKDLESKLATYLKFLDSCRPLSVSIHNCVRFLKHEMCHLPKEISKDEAKDSLCMSINKFVEDDILLAKKAIRESASEKISPGDNILVFAYSSLVKAVLCEAHDQKKSFQVLVADSRHRDEGNEMIRQLREHGLRCSYVPSCAISSIMKSISKVIIGAHALLSNGFVMSRSGCKEIALFASYYNVPVLVCCETYKFCERALTDSCVHNELGRPEELIRSNGVAEDYIKKMEQLSSMQMYNILYDVTPSDLISVVITEKGLLPTTSVPVVLRTKHAGWQE